MHDFDFRWMAEQEQPDEFGTTFQFVVAFFGTLVVLGLVLLTIY